MANETHAEKEAGHEKAERKSNAKDEADLEVVLDRDGLMANHAIHFEQIRVEVQGIVVGGIFPANHQVVVARAAGAVVERLLRHHEEEDSGWLQVTARWEHLQPPPVARYELESEEEAAVADVLQANDADVLLSKGCIEHDPH